MQTGRSAYLRILPHRSLRRCFFK